MIDRGLGVLPQPPAQTCCSAPMALFKRIGASQVGNWPYSFQPVIESAMAIIDALGYSTVCAKMGSSKSHNRTQTSKESHLF